jgi:hypothetical protein
VYARRIRELLRANPNTPETGLAPAFQQLVTSLLPTLNAVPQLTVVPEFNQPGVGRPDIALKRQGQPARAFIELKAPSKPGNPARWREAHDKRQFARLQELAHWAPSNFVEFQLYQRDESFGSATIVPERALNPDTPDATADRLIQRHDPEPFLELLAILGRADPPAARDAAQLAELLAHSARLVRGIVQERLAQLRAEGVEQDPLLLVREEFRNVLYAHPEAGGYPALDFDLLFSSAFAQTLAFGLLLVREALTTKPGLTDEDRKVGPNAWQHMPEEHPLMRATLRVLSEPEITREIGIGFEVMCDTVNSFAPEILAIQENGRDPILYFYEDFLETFDPEAREKYGVYYTPIEVVRYIVGALDRALRENLGTQGLRDPNVHILDPATGTGTFLLGVAERVRDHVLEEASPAEAAMALAELAGRTFGFELLVGPYAVAHYRLHHALRTVPVREGEERPDVDLPRLGIYLADTLSDPRERQVAGSLGIQGIPINEEREQANRIKNDQPILGILGNPPYRRLEAGENLTLVGQWMDRLWDDLKEPVREVGQGSQLNTFPEFSVAFWRWAMWKLFESPSAPRRGVVAFISNRKFLTGWPYAGLRQMMRERFDRIDIVDLRGDVNAGPRGDVESDQGVFNIKVGTAITIAIADGSKEQGTLASVRYADAWAEERFSRNSKLTWLETIVRNTESPEFVAVDRGILSDFRPEPFQIGNWLSLSQCFQTHGLGIQSKRDHIVYHVSAAGLRQRIQSLIALEPREFQTQAAFRDAASATRARAAGYDEAQVTDVAYRPLDNRSHYSHARWNYSLRPWLFRNFQNPNFALYTLAQGVGAGPAVWCVGRMPDYHAFRGSYGGYAFALRDHSSGPNATNISPTLLTSLAEAYGESISDEDAFDAILALLSATSYTRRFAEDLENTFAHVPFPASLDAFRRAVDIGREIRAVESFAREAQSQGQPFCQLETQPTGDVAAVDYQAGEIMLCADGSGRISGIPKQVWDFAVSGYRVLPRWIESRVGLPADLAFVRELRDVAARIAELIHRFDEADLVLADTLANSLTREELGFVERAGEPAEEEDGGD